MKNVYGCLWFVAVIGGLVVLVIGSSVIDVFLIRRRACSGYSFQDAAADVKRSMDSWIPYNPSGVEGAKVCVVQKGRVKDPGDPESPFIVAICNGPEGVPLGYLEVYEDCEKEWVALKCPASTADFSC